MVNIVTWVQTQNQEKLAQIRLETEVTPKTSLFKVLDNLEKAYHKDDIEKLVFWLAYAKLHKLPVAKGREFFKKIEELWPSSQAKHPELANKFHFLNEIYTENYTERNNSAQMHNYSSLLAEFSRV